MNFFRLNFYSLQVDLNVRELYATKPPVGSLILSLRRLRKKLL